MIYTKDPDAIARLSPEEYRVTQESGTERPGTGALLDNKEPGIYVDIVSGEPLFASSDKYESGCGWPSFTKPIEPAHISELRDTTHGMIRTEVLRISQSALRRLVWAPGGCVVISAKGKASRVWSGTTIRRVLPCNACATGASTWR